MSDNNNGAPAPSGPLSSAEEPEHRPQAEPLPSKRGEIGFIEGVHTQVQYDNHLPTTPLSARHPADRDSPSTTTPTASEEQSSPSSLSDNVLPSSSSTKGKLFLGVFRPVLWGGFHTSTVTLFTIQCLFLIGTIVAWIFGTKLLQRLGSGSQLPGGLSTAVFGHVVFVIVIIGELVFLERRLFRLRGERYSYLHPGEILPRHRGAAGSHPGLAFAPWNRPPLPTYAAALAQSGHGTGDVEDHIIAAPPPPAYGNTRGSTFLLSGFMRQSLLVQRPPSIHSQSSGRRASGVREHPNSRPVSYSSTDQDRETVQEADRARRLEETLNRLENTETGRPVQGPSRS